MTEFKPFALRVEADNEILETVQSAFEQLPLSFCDVTGFGELRWIALQFGETGDQTVFEGPLQLIDFKGRLRQAGDMILADYTCTVARMTDNGVQVLGGKLKEAEVSYVELTFSPVEAVESSSVNLSQPPTQKTLQDNSRQKAFTLSSSKPRTESQPKQHTLSDRDRWAKAVLESKKVQQNADYLNDNGPEVRPARGDFVIHQQFGECKVIRMGDDHITLKKPDERNVQLGLPILKFTQTGEKDGKDVFTVQVKRKR